MRTVTARVSVRETLLLRQNKALESLVKEAEARTLVDFNGVLIVVEEALVRDILRAATPLEAEVGGGFRIRIESADATTIDVTRVNPSRTPTFAVPDWAAASPEELDT